MMGRLCLFVGCVIPVVTACSCVSQSSQTRAPATEGARLTFSVALHVRGSGSGILRNGDSVVSGDRMQLQIQASENANLYIAYCAEDGELAMFPQYGSIPAKAGEITYAPARDGEILLDDNTGPEALYVIVSRFPLEHSDPQLAAVIAATRHNEETADCGEHFRALGAERSSESPEPKNTGKSSQAKPVNKSPVDKQAGKPSPSRPINKSTVDKLASKPPDESIERAPERGAYVIFNGGAGVAADAAGIAIVRYGLRHIAPASGMHATSLHKP
jgi:hypothetical protein